MRRCPLTKRRIICFSLFTHVLGTNGRKLCLLSGHHAMKEVLDSATATELVVHQHCTGFAVRYIHLGVTKSVQRTHARSGYCVSIVYGTPPVLRTYLCCLPVSLATFPQEMT